jgi:hypothetical protein
VYLLGTKVFGGGAVGTSAVAYTAAPGRFDF